jgi:hypothetical protein
MRPRRRALNIVIGIVITARERRMSEEAPCRFCLSIVEFPKFFCAGLLILALRQCFMCNPGLFISELTIQPHFQPNFGLCHVQCPICSLILSAAVVSSIRCPLPIRLTNYISKPFFMPTLQSLPNDLPCHVRVSTAHLQSPASSAWQCPTVQDSHLLSPS